MRDLMREWLSLFPVTVVFVTRQRDGVLFNHLRDNGVATIPSHCAAAPSALRAILSLLSSLLNPIPASIPRGHRLFFLSLPHCAVRPLAWPRQSPPSSSLTSATRTHAYVH
nr:hypothetical protein [Pandoravirus aubagnensis]